MTPEQQLREAIEAEITRQVRQSLADYDRYLNTGSKGKFELALPHDNAAARRLQGAIRDVLYRTAAAPAAAAHR